MPIGDPLYQLNDLDARVKRLENAQRAISQPTAKAAPGSPLVASTSRGEVIPGMSADTYSRLTTALQSSLTGVESAQDAIDTSVSINFGGGATQTLHQTNYFRPDPVVGDTYHLIATGLLTNTSGGAATLSFQLNIAGSNLSIGPVATVNNDVRFWNTRVLLTTTAGGTSGVFDVGSQFFTSSLATLTIPQGIDTTNCFLNAAVITRNLIAPTLGFVVVSSVVSANITVQLHTYILLRYGYGRADRV